MPSHKYSTTRGLGASEPGAFGENGGTTAADAVGTFPHYNLFGTYLAFVFAVVAAAGTEGTA